MRSCQTAKRSLKFDKQFFDNQSGPLRGGPNTGVRLTGKVTDCLSVSGGFDSRHARKIVTKLTVAFKHCFPFIDILDALK